MPKCNQIFGIEFGQLSLASSSANYRTRRASQRLQLTLMNDENVRVQLIQEIQYWQQEMLYRTWRNERLSATFQGSPSPIKGRVCLKLELFLS